MLFAKSIARDAKGWPKFTGWIVVVPDIEPRSNLELYAAIRKHGETGAKVEMLHSDTREKMSLTADEFIAAWEGD